MTFADEISAGLADVATEAGREITLRRHSDEKTVTATPAATNSEVEGDDHLKLEQTFRDYIIAVADYDFGNGAVEPEPGDEIDDLGETYELIRRGSQSPSWEYSDRGHTYYRVHCERKS